MWSDEGISLARAGLPTAEMLAVMPVEHVPGYFLLLRAWIALTGSDDFAVRYLSLLPSVWAVALIYRLAADLGSRRIGALAALLLATNAFQVWYAQEARMYSWLLAAGLLSTVAFWRLWTRPPGWGVWLIYVAATTATIYLHFFGFLAPLTQAVWVGLRLAWPRQGRAGTAAALRWWIAAGVAVALLFAPWAARGLEVLAFDGWRAPLDPRRVPWMLLAAYSVGETMPAPWSAWLPWGYAALALAGLAAWHRRRPAAAGLLLTLVGVAMGVVWLLVVRQPDFHVRYPIFLAAPLLLLAAGGIVGLDPGWWQGRAAGRVWLGLASVGLASVGLASVGLIVGGLVAANGLALQRLYGDTSLHKPNFRSAADTIDAGVTATDVVLVDGPNPDLVFARYYDGPAPVVDLRGLDGAPWAEVDATLAAATQGAARAWELLFFHPPGPVQVWLATRGWPAAASLHNGIRISLYGLDRGPLSVTPQGIAFGPALTLVSSAAEGPQVAVADLVRLTTTWQVHAPLSEYKFSLRLLTADGQVALADDYVPQNWLAPTSQWQVGAPAEDRRALFLPTTLPPGGYTLTLRVYDAQTGLPVETVAGQDVLLAQLDVAAAR